MRRGRISLLVASLALAPWPALAHHAMGGAVPATAWEGIVSGIAHPVIGLDHLAFLLAAGMLAAGAPRHGGIRALAAFLVAGLAGALLHLAGIGAGPVEAAVALSVLIAGAALLAPASRRSATWLPLLFALAGVFHGHAYAEAVAGAGPGPVAAYLATLAVAQAGISLAAMAAARRIGVVGSTAPQRRWAGISVASVGAVALAAAVLA